MMTALPPASTETKPCPMCAGCGLINEAALHSAADPRAIFALSQHLLDQQREHLVAFALNVKMKITHRLEISTGTLDGALVTPRDIFAALITAGAYAFILVHNHPSGDPEPSQHDLTTTKALLQAGKLMEIPLMDHVIVSRTGYYSLRERDNWLWNYADRIEG